MTWTLNVYDAATDLLLCQVPIELANSPAEGTDTEGEYEVPDPAALGIWVNRGPRDDSLEEVWFTLSKRSNGA